MSSKGKNIINGIIWLSILILTIITNSSQLILSVLFTYFVLNLTHNISEKMSKRIIMQKIYSIIITISIFISIIILLYYSFSYMIYDLNKLIIESQTIIIKTLKEYEIKNISSISQFYDYILEISKSNVGIITTSATLLIKVIIGIIFGFVFFISKIDIKPFNTLEGILLYDIKKYSKEIFNNFKNIMEIQFLVSIMNTTIISIFSILITYAIYGEMLPYYYIIIPLTAILSLIPVIGNLLINLILIMATIQISLTYAIFGILMFVGIHKLELALIGNKIKNKVGLPFSFVLISMLLGELLFHSMSGMILGMVITITLSNLSKKIPFKK